MGDPEATGFDAVLSQWRGRQRPIKQALATAMGFDRSYVSYVESGRHPASADFPPRRRRYWMRTVWTRSSAVAFIGRVRQSRSQIRGGVHRRKSSSARIGLNRSAMERALSVSVAPTIS
jgi:hypothetical protein